MVGVAELTLQDQFDIFHGRNPHVYRALEAMSLRLHEQHPGRRFGIGMLYEVLRYRTMLRTKGDDYKLNNNWRSRYARMLLEEHPELAESLEVRELRA